MALITLTYVSVASRKMTHQDILDILEVSRENNSAHNITGMLLYRDNYFIQALEGDESDVMPLYRKIEQDDRHRHVLLVSTEQISERSFADWSMGFHRLDNEDVKNLDGYTDFLDQSFDINDVHDTSSRAVAFLNLFRSGVNY